MPVVITKETLDAWYKKTGHSLFGPSSLSRAILCNAAAQETLDAPEEEPSEFAAHGTMLHEKCEFCMKKAPKAPLMMAGMLDLEEEDMGFVHDALEYVMDVKERHLEEPTIRLEAEVSLVSWDLEEVEGTADVIIESSQRIDVLDYKFGRGIQVFAENNPQCFAYLGGAVRYQLNGSQQDMYVHIVQPPLNHYDCVEVSWDELSTKILEEIRPAVQASRRADAQYGPCMEACRWCNAKMICDARREHIKQVAAKVQRAAASPTMVAKRDWKEILDGSDDLTQAIKDVHKFAQAEIKSGRGFDGYKMVAGRSKRVFVNQAEGEAYILKTLGEEKAYAPAKMISLAQAEKKATKLKKDPKWKKLITKPTGKPLLVSEKDPRPALEYGMQNEFAADALRQGDVMTKEESTQKRDNVIDNW